MYIQITKIIGEKMLSNVNDSWQDIFVNSRSQQCLIGKCLRDTRVFPFEMMIFYILSVV